MVCSTAGAKIALHCGVVPEPYPRNKLITESALWPRAPECTQYNYENDSREIPHSEFSAKLHDNPQLIEKANLIHTPLRRVWPGCPTCWLQVRSLG
jgi:hypothetical protein